MARPKRYSCLNCGHPMMRSPAAQGPLLQAESLQCTLCGGTGLRVPGPDINADNEAGASSLILWGIVALLLVILAGYLGSAFASEGGGQLPRWAIVSYVDGWPIWAEFERTQSECTQRAKMRNVNAERSGLRNHYRCVDMMAWGQEASA